MRAHKKQRIFIILVILAIAVILTCIFVACDKTGAQDKNYTVTIHPNNGQSDIVWDVATDIPSITKYGYHIVGYYLDADMTISTTLESLKASELTSNLDVYVKWEKDSVPPKTKINTTKLLCDYDNRTLSGKVSNSTTVFSFSDEISVEKGATYTVSTDITGINVIPSKTVNLEIGDNVFYIVVSNEDELTLYTATVRRRPIYEVVFNVKGGTEVEAQQVEEDSLATAPTTEKNGCTFEKWDWDFATPITQNTTITAIWNAFIYNIIYDLNIPEDSVSQDVDNSRNPTTYTVDDTIYFSAPRRNGYYFTGWSVDRIDKGTTGTIGITAHWSPIPYEIIYDFDDENSVSKATNSDLNPRYYYIESDEISFAEPTRTGYTFVSWDKNIEKGTTGAQIITASWNVNQYNIDYVLNGWKNAENSKTTYTIEDKTFALLDGVKEESLFCGWYLDDEYTTYIETIDASTMQDYTVYAMPDCSATKGLTIENGVVKGYSGTSNEVVIPSFYKGYAVDSLVESSFKDCAILTSVTVPNSVTKIETGSFSGCSYLENITIPFVGAKAGVTSGDKYQYPFGYIFGTASYDGGVATKQYYYGSSTSSTTYSTYYIPSSLQSVVFIGEDILYGAFNNCSGLDSITIDDSVKSIGEDAFLGCSGLTSVYITDIAKWCSISFENFTSSPLYYGDNLYLNGELVKDLTIPDSVTRIGSYSFYGCSGLMSVTIPDSVKSIGDFAFSGCTGLTKITGPADMVSAVAKQCDSKAFEVVITSGTSIGDRAFYGCTGLTSITIPNGVTSIGSYAFSGCTGLTSITIPNGVTSIGDSAFSGCTGLTTVNWNATACASAGSYSYTIFSSCLNITTVDIGSNVTTIPSYVFSGCSGLTSVTIPDSVTSIGDSAFSGCTGLTSITIPNGVTRIDSFAFYGCTGLTSVAIPDGVTSIGSSAFSGCTGLTSITIPDGVTSIGSSAFYHCYRLIEVHNKSTLSITAGSFSNGYIAYYAKNVYTTEGGSKLTTDENGYVIYTNEDEKILVDYTGIETKLTLPIGISEIYNSTFSGCSGLTSITIPDSVTSIGMFAFSGCSGLTSITIPDGVTSIGSSAFYGCTGLTSITIPNGVTRIDSFAFYGCTGLTSITIPNGVTRIDSFAFYGCTGLTSITIPDGVTSIGSSAFYGCTGLTNITIPDSVTSIGYYTFYNCWRLTSVAIPDGVTSIGDFAFYGCSGLTSITIPDSVTSIGRLAFSGCWRLSSITIPNGVTSIGDSAFSGCWRLSSIKFKGTKAQWEAITKGDNWNDGVATNCTIICSDGTI